MLFERRFWPSIADGSVTLTFRRWKRPQAVAGRPYRTAAGIIAVSAVDVVTADAITDDEAIRSGYPSAVALVADLRGPPELPVYRIEFAAVSEPDPRAVLAATTTLSPAELDELDRRLARLDRASPRGPWTAAVLDMIAAQPEVRAGDLADALGRDRASFKLDVRKLKALGLTLSLGVGYRLSPRGEAYRAVSRARAGTGGPAAPPG